MKKKKHKLLRVLGISALATLILVLDKKVSDTEGNLKEKKEEYR